MDLCFPVKHLLISCLFKAIFTAKQEIVTVFKYILHTFSKAKIHNFVNGLKTYWTPQQLFRKNNSFFQPMLGPIWNLSSQLWVCPYLTKRWGENNQAFIKVHCYFFLFLHPKQFGLMCFFVFGLNWSFWITAQHSMRLSSVLDSSFLIWDALTMIKLLCSLFLPMQRL